MTSPYDGFDAEFTYKFISDDELLVENERAKDGRWYDIQRWEKTSNLYLVG